jgi:hypothetical protein
LGMGVEPRAEQGDQQQGQVSRSVVASHGLCRAIFWGGVDGRRAPGSGTASMMPLAVDRDFT